MLKVVNKMKPGLSFLSISAIAAALILFSCRASTQPSSQRATSIRSAYLGFDLNIFPGKAALPVLRKTFCLQQLLAQSASRRKNKQLARSARAPACRKGSVFCFYIAAL